MPLAGSFTTRRNSEPVGSPLRETHRSSRARLPFVARKVCIRVLFHAMSACWTKAPCELSASVTTSASGTGRPGDGRDTSGLNVQPSAPSVKSQDFAGAESRAMRSTDTRPVAPVNVTVNRLSVPSQAGWSPSGTSRSR